MPSKRTEARRRAEARYKDKTYDRIAINVLKGVRDVWKDAAEKRGLSLRRLVVDGVEEYMENHPVEGEQHGEG